MIKTVKQKSCKLVEGLYAIIHYHNKAVQLSLVEIWELKTIPGHRLIDTPISPYAVAVYTGTVQTSLFHWHCFQTNWMYHFSPCYFNGIKIVTAFKCIFEETVPKLSVNFGNHSSQDSHKNNLPARSGISVLRNHNTVTNLYQICCWSAISFPLVTHTDDTVLSDKCDHLIHALVDLFGTSFHVLILTIWSDDVITVPVYNGMWAIVYDLKNREY